MANTFISSFVKKNKSQFQKYKKYILNNDWSSIIIDENLSEDLFVDYIDKEQNNKKVIKSEIAKYVKEKLAAQKSNIKYKSDEFKLQNEIIGNILDRIKYFVKKSEGDHHLKEFKTFIKECMSIISIHTDRVDFYVNSVDISTIENQDLRSEEMKFLKDCFAGVTKVQDAVTELNIKEDSAETTGIAFHENKPAPLSMHHILSELYPEIKRAVEGLKIDFTSPPNNEMHIYNTKPQIYNPDKHYWQQEREVLQYYVDEFKKIREGITIDGEFIPPWLYYHLNVFVTYFPVEKINKHTGEEESEDMLGNPPLRDTDFFIIRDNYLEAKRQGKLLFLAATRRAAKTTLLASHFDWCATIGKNQLLCAGGSTKDLGQIEKNFKTTVLNKNPAFATYNLTNDWSKKVELGIKTKGGKTIPLSTLNVVNLSSGGDKSSEVLAGYTPDAFCIDEIMKAPFISQLEAIKPALDSPYGKRCVGILSGTAGNEDLSKDAMDVLNFPEVHDVLEMDFKALERGVPLEEITWKKRKFGTFVPAQMSAKEGMIKVDSDLSKYLNRPDSEELRKIKIKVTDWKKCNEIIKKDRDKKITNRTSYTKEILYYPISIDEMFMSGKVNPFCVNEAKAHRDYLIQTGKWDRRREVFRNSQGGIEAKISTRELIGYPHRGDNIDAPFLILEDLPVVKPPAWMYSFGGDDYKQQSSDTDSVAAGQIWKQEIFGDPFSKKLVASIATKPEKHSKVHEQWLLLMEAYNISGTAFIENEDFAIKEYLDSRHLTEKYLAPSVAFTQTFNISNNLKRAFGWSPAACKKVLMNLFIEYCNEDVLSLDSEGNEITIKGVQRIDDIWLLEEIIQYTENSNVDRISAALGGVSYLHFLQSTYQLPKILKSVYDNVQKEEKAERQKSFYTTPKKRAGFYGGRRR